MATQLDTGKLERIELLIKGFKHGVVGGKTLLQLITFHLQLEAAVFQIDGLAQQAARFIRYADGAAARTELAELLFFLLDIMLEHRQLAFQKGQALARFSAAALHILFKIGLGDRIDKVFGKLTIRALVFDHDDLALLLARLADIQLCPQTPIQTDRRALTNQKAGSLVAFQALDGNAGFLTINVERYPLTTDGICYQHMPVGI